MDKNSIKIFSGKDSWSFSSSNELNIREIRTSDGPNGLRKMKKGDGLLDKNKTVKATCFPSASTISCSFNKELLWKVGEAIGKECSKNEVDVLLGPSINIKRSPLGGRNFEYFSEDPYLTSQLAAEYIKGVHSTKTEVAVKHFAANSQEYARMINDSVIDERTLREIYLTAFEYIVKETTPKVIMASYNKINGIYACENKYLLTDILRKEWGFEGVVISDWGAVNNRVEALKAGLDIEMPNSNGFFDESLIAASEDKELEDACKQSIHRLQKLSKVIRKEYIKEYNQEEHNDLVKKAISESAVLLKNENNLLPLLKEDKILIVGELFEKPRIQGGGSSHINPTNVATPKIAFEKNGISYDYLPGYNLKSDYIDKSLIKNVLKVAPNYNKIIVFVGLTDFLECEGMDREDLSLPKTQLELIDSLTLYYDNVIILINDGSVIEMPFAEDVNAIMKIHLLGQTGAYAIPDLLYGKVSPSGRLAETYPLKIIDTPSYYDYKNNPKASYYLESLYVGYRYYETANKEAQFPFGYGLSYSEFEYSDLKIKALGDNKFLVNVDVKNIGNYDASEVVQLYISMENSNLYRSKKELKGFEKIFLKRNEKKTVKFELDKTTFRFFDIDSKSFEVEAGEYQIIIGKSAHDNILQEKVTLNGKTYISRKEELPNYYTCAVFGNEEFEKILGYKMPLYFDKKEDKLDYSSTMKELSRNFIAKIVIDYLKSKYLDNIRNDKVMFEMIKKSFDYLPLRAMIMMSGGQFTKNFANELLKLCNGDLYHGFSGMIKQRPKKPKK